MNKKITRKRQLKGIVVSNSMNKTVVVKVDRIKIHPKYQKRYTSSKKYYAHAKEVYELGASVRIEECRPISKMKRWKVVEKL